MRCCGSIAAAILMISPIRVWTTTHAPKTAVIPRSTHVSTYRPWYRGVSRVHLRQKNSASVGTYSGSTVAATWVELSKAATITTRAHSMLATTEQRVVSTPRMTPTLHAKTAPLTLQKHVSTRLWCGWMDAEILATWHRIATMGTPARWTYVMRWP